MTLDAKAEAEKRWPADVYDEDNEGARAGKRDAFLAGAAWALRDAAREFAEKYAWSSFYGINVGHILGSLADGIEEGSDGREG